MTMAMDGIKNQLLRMKIQAEKSTIRNDFFNSTTVNRTKQAIMQQIAKAEKYRIVILRNVQVFASLADEHLRFAAQNMEEINYVRNDVVFNQDDIGDAFFIIQEGVVSVSSKTNPRDADELPKELARLNANSHFGELSLLTSEPRSATVTVISDTALLLRMSQDKFNEIMASCNSLLLDTRLKLGRDVVSKVPLFQSLTAINKRKLLDAMTPAYFIAGTYICKQGTFGNTFYILTEGTCKVTANKDDGGERDLIKLRSGDFFGEVALIDPSQRRSANVISTSAVTCMTLGRSDFELLLRSIKSVLMQFSAMRNTGIRRQKKEVKRVVKKRRISVLDENNFLNVFLMEGFFRRFSRFTMESLWCSLYSRFYREVTINPIKADEYGETASYILASTHTREEATTVLRRRVCEILQLEPHRRSVSEHKLVIGVLRQKNALKDRFCKSWMSYQYSDLCRKVHFLRIEPLKKIFEIDSRGTMVFLILRGSVRIFTNDPGANRETDPKSLRYDEDLIAGDIFGEVAFEGVYTRQYTAISITTCDLVVIDAEDYVSIQEGGLKKASVEDRYKYLSSLSLFKSWEPYKLIRIAQSLLQEDLPKGSVIVRKGEVSHKLMFIRSGRLDMVHSLDNLSDIATFVQVNDYFGESGFVAAAQLAKGISKPVKECCYGVAYGRIELYTLAEEHHNLFDSNTISQMTDCYFEKVKWRTTRSNFLKKQRYKQKEEKVKLMRAKRKEEQENAMLTPQQRTKLKEVQVMQEKRMKANETSEDSNLHHLYDIEDIPFLLDCPSDPLLIMNSCKNERDLKAVLLQLKESHRPKSARSRRGSISSVLSDSESSIGNNTMSISRSDTGISTTRSRRGSGIRRMDSEGRRLILPLLPGAYISGGNGGQNDGKRSPPHTPGRGLLGSTRIPSIKSYYEMLTVSEAMIPPSPIRIENPQYRLPRTNSFDSTSSKSHSISHY